MNYNEAYNRCLELQTSPLRLSVSDLRSRDSYLSAFYRICQTVAASLTGLIGLFRLDQSASCS